MATFFLPGCFALPPSLLAVSKVAKFSIQQPCLARLPIFKTFPARFP
jgi:hypothetical protein